MMFFKCKHPFDHLVVLKQESSEQQDSDFEIVSYHFQCSKCGKILTKKYSKLIGGVEAFMRRASEK